MTSRTFQKQVEAEWQKAMNEIGPVTPWFDEDFQEWTFEHEAYPESYSGETAEEVIERYPLYIRQFIEERMKGNLAPNVERITSGRGGAREGAGRPKGTKKEARTRIMIDARIAHWLKEDPSREAEILKFIG